MWKTALATLAAAGLILSFVFQWNNPLAGYPSLLSDFSSHFAIIESLRHGDLFPELRQQAASEHSVSRFLPIYHGLIGSHAAALFISQITGTSTRAMQIFTDLLFLISFGCLLLLTRKSQLSYPAQALVLFCYFYNFTLLTQFGSFAQAAGITFGLVAFVLPEKFLRLRLFTLAFSAWCYPEVLVLVLPWAIWKRNLRIWQRILCLLIYVLLMAVLIKRFPLPGGLPPDFMVQLPFVLTLTLIVWQGIFEKRSPRWTDPATYAFAMSSLLLLAVSWLWLGKLTYYSQKLLYWTPLFLLLALADRRRPRLEALFCLLVFFNIIWDWNGVRYNFKEYFKKNSALTHEAETEARAAVVQGPCQDGAFFVESADREGAMTLTMALSSLTGRYNVHQGNFSLKGITAAGTDRPLPFNDYQQATREILKKSDPSKVEKSKSGQWSYICP